MIYSITWSNIAVSWKWEIMETEFRVNDSVCNWLEIQASPRVWMWMWVNMI